MTGHDIDRSDPALPAWVEESIGRVEADATRSADAHLRHFPLAHKWGIDLYLKDESTHPTGLLKHRLARSLVLYGLATAGSCWVGPWSRRPRGRRRFPRRTSPGCSGSRSAR